MTTLFIPLNNIIKKPLIPVFLFFALLFSGAAFSQAGSPSTVGRSSLSCDISNRNPCTSKDLEIVSIAVDAPACATCTPGQTVTYPLKMTIHNGTKSERTSFALYGSLSSGASINGISGNVFICVGSITVKSDQLLQGESAPGNQTFAAGTITFVCGQDLTLSNNFLAWTDAAGATVPRCSTFLAATKCADIAPKCGTAASITITQPVAAPTLAKVDPTCTVGTGSVTVTSSTTGLTFSIDGGAYAAYPTGGWSGLAPGEHCVTSTRTSDGCVSPPGCITIPAQPATPAAPTLGKVDPTCTVATGKVTVTSATTGLTFSLDGGAFTAYPTGGWTANPGEHCVRAQNAAGCISSPSCITIPGQPATPGGPTLGKVDPTCTVATGKVTITSSTTGLTFSLDGGAFTAYPTGGWTANPGEHCVRSQNADGCISSPSCITIPPQPATPGAPTLGKVDPTCTVATGKVTVTSSTTGLTFSLDGGAFTAYPTGGWTVNPGEHCIRAQNAVGCISSPTCITIPAQPATPQQPTVTITEPKLCGPSTATVTVTCPIGSGYQYSNNGGAYQASPEFSGLAAGAGFSITVKNSAGCISTATDCSNYQNVSCTNPTTAAKAITASPLPNETKVKAAPNPFNDRIRFSFKSAVSGQGSLDLYNMLGQKVKTVYQGYIEKGKNQTIEYSVPNSQRTNLIYQFRVGNERTTGKLIGLK